MRVVASQHPPLLVLLGRVYRLLLASMIVVALSAGAAAEDSEDGTLPPLWGFDGFSARAGDDLKLTARFVTEPDGNRGALQITAELAEGAYIYSITQPPGGPQRTEILLDSSAAFELTGPFQPDVAPKVKQSKVFPVPEEFHEGRVTWSAPILLADDTDVTQLVIAGRLEGQVCREASCTPLDDATFEARFAGTHEGLFIDGVSDAEPPPTVSGATIDRRLLLRNVAFGILGGMILNLMPCVLPVIGLKIMSFIEQSHGSHSRALQLNLVYSLGILTVFMVLASLAAGANLSWGEQFTHMPFKITMIALVFAMALSFLGVWEIPIPGFVGSGRSVELASREGAAGAFFKGVFATILATPCSGPFLGPVFGYTISQPPLVTYVIMFSVGFGMALPYLVIGLFPALARWIPRPGAWMETFKELMGFVLLATVVFLFSTLGNADYFVPTLSLLFGIWFACWIIGRVPITAAWHRKLISWLGAIGTAAVIGYLSLTFLTPQNKHIDWQPFSPVSLAEAQDQGKTVLVDFTAQWCATCRLNLAMAIDTREVGDLVGELDAVPLIADWTNRSDVIKQALQELGSDSIPLLAIYPGNDPTRPIILRDLVTKQQVLDALEAAGPSIGTQQVSSRSSSTTPRQKY